MAKTVVVESFTLDHTKVEAPYVRTCSKLQTPKGDWIYKFDLRFTQPNQEFLDTGSIHTLEHLLAGYMREVQDDIVDISPMGCRTGFYLIFSGEASNEQIAKALIYGLKKVQTSTEVPAANEFQCGNYRDMNLEGAIAIATKVLEGLERKYSA